MQIPDVNGSGRNDTQFSVEIIHEDHVIVEPSKLQAEKEAAIFVEENNGINVYCHQDNGEEEKTVNMFYMDADKKREFLIYLNRMEDTDQCQMNNNLEITSVYRQDGVKTGYDLKIRDMEVSIKFRWNQGIMVGSLRPLPGLQKTPDSKKPRTRIYPKQRHNLPSLYTIYYS